MDDPHLQYIWKNQLKVKNGEWVFDASGNRHSDCCLECNEREGKKLYPPQWKKIGLPRDGWCECGKKCKCTLESCQDLPF